MCQRIFSVPQAVDQRADLARAQRIVTRCAIEPPVTDPGDPLQRIGFRINYPIAPVVGSFGFASMWPIGIHGDDRMGGDNILCAAITKTFGFGFYRANIERFMGVRLESVIRDVCMIQLSARYLRQMVKVGAIFLINKSPRYTLRVFSPHASSCHYQRGCAGMLPRLINF